MPCNLDQLSADMSTAEEIGVEEIGEEFQACDIRPTGTKTAQGGEEDVASQKKYFPPSVTLSSVIPHNAHPHLYFHIKLYILQIRFSFQ